MPENTCTPRRAIITRCVGGAPVGEIVTITETRFGRQWYYFEPQREEAPERYLFCGTLGCNMEYV